MTNQYSTVLTTTISALTVSILAFGTFAANAQPISIAARQTVQPPITIWTKFNDQNPQNSQDKWLAAFLAEYAAKTGNKAANVFQPYDQIDSKINIAVQSGGDVPDMSYVDTQNVPFFSKNGDLLDLTDYVKNAPWFKDINPNAVADCTAPDGKIYCVPTSGSAQTVYYWKDYFPKGFPAVAQDLLSMAKDFKAANPGKYIVTLKGSEALSFQQTWFPLIMSAGGTIADPKTGLATWANDKTAAVVQWARDLFNGQYAPQVDLATSFDDETPFTKADAASFLAGSWSYVYLNPLIAPDGTKFDKDSASVQAAFDAGKMGFAAPLAWQGGHPVSMLSGTAYGIPVGSKNVEAAKAFINYAMQTQQNADFAVAYGALPTMTSSLADPRLNTGYWKAIADNQSKYGTVHPFLTDYDKGITALTDAINKLVADPKADIMQTLQAAQDNYNNGLK
jgi:multiple sugar transport system substrate-binding protein